MLGSWDELNADELRLGEDVDRKLRELRRLLDADYIRLWRYVDSQKVIFGFRWFSGDDEDRTQIEAFSNYVGFRRRPLQPPGAFHVVSLNGTGDHPYWHFPEFNKLKPNRRGFIEAVLARSEREYDLDGLVCAGVSPDSWGHIQLDPSRVAAIAALLRDLHSLVQLFSLQRFHSAFIVDGEARWWPQSSLLDFTQPQTPQRILATLAASLDTTASFYLRDPEDFTLYAGVGSFYEHLKTFEDPDGGNALANEEYKSGLLTGHAMREFIGETPKPMLFPGSPDFETYEDIRARFGTWVETVIRLSAENEVLKRHGETLSSAFADIGRSGSFGVFPVRAEDVGGVQALLCAASMERNFFRWRTRIAIQEACQWLSHNLPGARPLRNLLHRVSRPIADQLRAKKDFRDELVPKAVVHTRDRLRRRRRTDRGSKDDVYLKAVSAFVLSADVRHSTQLMRDTLKPAEYAAFLTNLSRDLADEIKEQYGVFDKFTGDGILAFFPTAIFKNDRYATALWAIAAAERCHARFAQLFDTLRPFWPSWKSRKVWASASISAK
jgi:hypothetical protein